MNAAQPLNTQGERAVGKRSVQKRSVIPKPANNLFYLMPFNQKL